jgi:hypothetical protein
MNLKTKPATKLGGFVVCIIVCIQSILQFTITT